MIELISKHVSTVHALVASHPTEAATAFGKDFTPITREEIVKLFLLADGTVALPAVAILPYFSAFEHKVMVHTSAIDPFFHLTSLILAFKQGREIPDSLLRSILTLQGLGDITEYYSPIEVAASELFLRADHIISLDLVNHQEGNPLIVPLHRSALSQAISEHTHLPLDQIPEPGLSLIAKLPPHLMPKPPEAELSELQAAEPVKEESAPKVGVVDDAVTLQIKERITQMLNEQVGEGLWDFKDALVDDIAGISIAFDVTVPESTIQGIMPSLAKVVANALGIDEDGGSIQQLDVRGKTEEEVERLISEFADASVEVDKSDTDTFMQQFLADIQLDVSTDLANEITTSIKAVRKDQNKIASILKKAVGDAEPHISDITLAMRRVFDSLEKAYGPDSPALDEASALTKALSAFIDDFSRFPEVVKLVNSSSLALDAIHADINTLKGGKTTT
jgi:hypothetical protein